MIKTYFAGQEIPQNEKYVYIAAKDGYFIQKKNGLFESCTRIDEIPDLPEQKETFELKAKRIPYDLIKQVLAFFFAVYQKHRTEAMVLLCYEQDNWSVYVPEQEVSTGSVKYQNDKHTVVGSIHSHPSFSCQASGVDDRDEANFDGIHIIISKFEDVCPEIACYVVINARRFEIEAGTIIDGLAQPCRMVSEEWLKQVKPLDQMPVLTNHEQPGQQTVFKSDKKEEITAADKGSEIGEKINMTPEEQCFYCSHQEVCLQDVAEPGMPCDFFDRDFNTVERRSLYD